MKRLAFRIRFALSFALVTVACFLMARSGDLFWLAFAFVGSLGAIVKPPAQPLRAGYKSNPAEFVAIVLVVIAGVALADHLLIRRLFSTSLYDMVTAPVGATVLWLGFLEFFARNYRKHLKGRGELQQKSRLPTTWRRLLKALSCVALLGIAWQLPRSDEINRKKPNSATITPTAEEQAIAEIKKLGRFCSVERRAGGKFTTKVFLARPSPQITDADLEHLKALTHLEELTIQSSQITDAGLEHLRGLTRLLYLRLITNQITDAGLEHLRDLSNLRTLDLTGNPLTGPGLEHLKGLPRLRGLELNYTPITGAGLKPLEGLTGLRDLQLNNTQITNAGLEHLRGLELTTLYLSNTRITDAGLEHLRNLASLRSLGLGNTQITDVGLEHLGDLPSLRGLTLSNTQITDAGLEHLRGIELSTLYLSNTQITDAGLENLRGLTSLQNLRLNNTQITDTGLERLGDLTNLQHLWLNDTQITDAGLEHLKGLTNLDLLHLDNTAITDAGLEHLRGMTKLRFLNHINTKVTASGIENLKEILPECNRITRSGKRATPTKTPGAAPPPVALSHDAKLDVLSTYLREVEEKREKHYKNGKEE